MNLAEFDLKISHISGSKNTMADYLSRQPIDKTVEMDMIPLCNTIQQIDITVEQARDDNLKKIIMALRNPEIAESDAIRKSRRYELKDDVLYFKKFNEYEGNSYLLAIPDSLKDKILKEFHDSKIGGHLSAKKITKKIADRYYWDNMNKYIKEYTATCDSCQLRNFDTQKKPGLLKPIIPSEIPCTSIQIDTLGPLPMSAHYRYILLVTDMTTRYCWGFPMRSADGKTISKILLDLFLEIGFPKRICSDSGTEYVNDTIKNLLQTMQITLEPGNFYRPQGQGQVERLNKTVVVMISHFIDNEPARWSKLLKYCIFAYNSSVHSSLGFTPHYLFHGFEPRVPFDTILVPHNTDKDLLEEIENLQLVRKVIPTLLEPAQQHQKTSYDKNKVDFSFSEGQQVLVKRPYKPNDPEKKFQRKFDCGKVVKRLSSHSYLIEMEKFGRLTQQKIHIARLKKYRRRPKSEMGEEDGQEDIEEDGEEEAKEKKT